MPAETQQSRAINALRRDFAEARKGTEASSTGKTRDREEIMEGAGSRTGPPGRSDERHNIGLVLAAAPEQL
jgi:hypothetical protein